MQSFDFHYLFSLLLGVIPALICITIHEFFHGATAYFLGDDTARNSGRLSLNPLRHLDPAGFLMMIIFHFGWAKPVPVNMMNFKHPKQGMAITALAGPVSNLLLTMVLLFLYGSVYRIFSSTGYGEYILEMLQLTAYMSLGLAVFNLIPIPPLDGSKIIFSFIRDDQYRKLMIVERYGVLLLLVLSFSGILGRPLNMLINRLFDCLFIIAQTAFRLFA